MWHWYSASGMVSPLHLTWTSYWRDVPRFHANIPWFYRRDWVICSSSLHGGEPMCGYPGMTGPSQEYCTPYTRAGPCPSHLFLHPNQIFLSIDGYQGTLLRNTDLEATLSGLRVKIMWHLLHYPSHFQGAGNLLYIFERHLTCEKPLTFLSRRPHNVLTTAVWASAIRLNSWKAQENADDSRLICLIHPSTD